MGYSGFSPRRFERTSVLVVDRELAASLGPEQLRRAEPLSVTRVLRRAAGPWEAHRDADHTCGGFGLLVLEGLLVRRVGIEPRYGIELLSEGDILQPDQHDGEDATLPFADSWKLLQPTRLAVLDAAWATRMSPFPPIGVALVTRALARSRRLASVLAITQHHRLEDRLEMLFRELADRFGTVRAEGVHIDVELTHQLISQLVGARRPSVSTALMRLMRDGRLARSDIGWLLPADARTTGWAFSHPEPSPA